MEVFDFKTFIGSKPNIYLLSVDAELCETLQSLWPNENIQWEVFSSGKALLERLFSEPPHILICGEESSDLSGAEIVQLVKAENVYRQVCTVLVMGFESFNAELRNKLSDVDDFIILPSTPTEMRTRLELALQRSSCTLDANPLTRLPGNASIMQTVEKHIMDRTNFAAAYLDIDNFKAFNDKYGFSRGDEALLVTARLLVATIMNSNAEYKFLGHIGGDDFFFILPADIMEETCQNLVSAYDEIIPNFYDAEDRANQGIISKDRAGNLQRFPFMSISLSVTVNTNARFTHYGEVSQAVGQIKKLCKAQEGSVYMFDRRVD